jgi:lysine-N-methylase
MLQAQFLLQFNCLGDACEDTCCKGWGMQVDAGMVEKYRREAPELLEAVTSGEAEHIMKRDPQTDYCVKFEGGWCGIHKTRGTAFLGDACHFFPRITRQLGAMPLQTASLSCPEVARLTLLQPAAFTLQEIPDERLPYSLRNYLPEGMTEASALAIHQAFLEKAGDTTESAESILCILHSAAQSLEIIPQSQWPEAVPVYLKMAQSRVPQPETHPADPFNLFFALLGLIGAAKPAGRPRLDAITTSIQKALKIQPPSEAGGSVALGEENLAAWQQMQARWQEQSAHWQPPLKRWIQAQLSAALFPFAGFGGSLSERMVIIAVRFATLKLALMAEENLTETDFIRITQSLARFMDHLADPTLSLQIYTETGWTKPARLRALLGDN